MYGLGVPSPCCICGPYIPPGPPEDCIALCGGFGGGFAPRFERSPFGP